MEITGTLKGIHSIIMIGLLMTTGFVLKRTLVITHRFQQDLTKLLMRVIFPMTIISSFLTPFDASRFGEIAIFLLLGILYFPLVQMIITPLLFKIWPKSKNKKKLFVIASTYPNAMYMGYPFIEALYGPIGLFYVSTFNIFFNFYLWSIGYAYVNNTRFKWEDLKAILRSPVVMACFGGLIWWFFSALLPSSSIYVLAPIYSTIRSIGSMSTPTSMIIIGAMLADLEIAKAFKDKEIWYFTIIKLIVLPAIVYITLKTIGLTSYALAIPTLITAMPMGASVSIMTANEEDSAKASPLMITITTMLSVISIFFWMLILGL